MTLHYEAIPEKDTLFVYTTGTLDAPTIAASLRRVYNDPSARNLRRRLIDFRRSKLALSTDEGALLIRVLEEQAKYLGTRRIAMLLGRVSPDLDIAALQALIDLAEPDMRLFLDENAALAFLAEPWTA